MQPKGAKKNKLAQAMFSKDGPNLNKPEVTNNPNVTPKMYKLIKRNINGAPILNIETPNNGIAKRDAGTNPISVLKTAVKVSAAMISDNLIGEINKLVKFRLQISSRNNILKLILDRNKKS